MNTLNFKDLNVGEVVADDFRTSKVFTNAGIDFCCGGNQSVKEACNEKGVNIQELEAQILKIKNTPVNPSVNFKEWDLLFLIDYIKNTHHKFVLNSLPELLFYTEKIARVHGENHSELIDIAGKVYSINDELLQHLKNEEEVLFPAIKNYLKSPNNVFTQTINSEINRMAGEHDFVGKTMDEINTITNEYQVPEDGCNTYRVAFELLKQFEDDLHIHVHLENNILFPKALLLAENQF